MINGIIDTYVVEEDRPKVHKFVRYAKMGLAALVAVPIILSNVYKIDANSKGVVQRFGAYVRTQEPGLRAKIPFIEDVTMVPVTTIQREEFGYRTIKSGEKSAFIGSDNIGNAAEGSKDFVSEDDIKEVLLCEEKDKSNESVRTRGEKILKSEYLMLTGDLNMADVEWITQFNIKDPVAYLFNIRKPKETIRDVSLSVMRQQIGNGSLDEAITIGRVDYEIAAKRENQKLLDEYQSGVSIREVKLQSANVPHEVRASFNEVVQALQQKEQRINQAMQEYNKIIPEARGTAKGMIEQANGYAAQRVNEAKGDVRNFQQIYEAYRKAPEVTRKRMFLETMEAVLPSIDEKFIIEQGNDGMLKLLRLNETSQTGGNK